MITDRFYKLIELAFDPWVNYLYVFQYTWNPQSKLFVKVFYDKRGLRLNRLNKILLTIWILLHFVQLFIFYRNRDFNSLIILVTNFIALTLALICWLLCTHLEDSWFSALNSAVIFLRNFNCKYFSYSMSFTNVMLFKWNQFFIIFSTFYA